jgi:hypothetical protein
MYFPAPENHSPVGLTPVLTKSTRDFVHKEPSVSQQSILHIQDLKSKPHNKSADKEGKL